MLKKILEPTSCGACRICCGFDESDKWEIPLIFSELRGYLSEHYPDIALEQRGDEYVFAMSFNGDEVKYCPMLTERGCRLGDNKPFDCRIWPFRVNSLDGRRVITVSPVCGEVSSLPLKVLTEFVQADGFAQELFKAAKEHPDMVKPYISGYPIVAVEE
ncbi:MAG: hypothetical protein E7478_10360 [Ruminococcaceae bacterium]|nr:hypothetical protein [Oscillospiraceae bacterium]